MELHEWLYLHFVEMPRKNAAPIPVPPAPEPARPVAPPPMAPASVPLPAPGGWASQQRLVQPTVAPGAIHVPGAPIGQRQAQPTMAPAVELDLEVGKALWWLFRSQFLIVEKVDLLGGDVHNSSHIAQALARKEGKAFADRDTLVKKLADSGKYPLVKNEHGPEGCIILNPSTDATERALNPTVLAPGRGWIVQLVKPVGKEWVPQEVAHEVMAPLGIIRGDDMLYDIISGPPGFLLPDPVQPGKMLENLARTGAEFAAYQEQRNRAMTEAESLIAGSGAYHTNTFVDCSPPPKPILDKTWIRLRAVAGATGAMFGSHMSGAQPTILQQNPVTGGQSPAY